MDLKNLTSVACATLLVGCASNVPEYNPAVDRSLTNYAKKLIEENKYHPKAVIKIADQIYEDYSYILYQGTSNLGGAPFTWAMQDACKAGGGDIEMLGGIYNNGKTPPRKIGPFYGFVCREGNKGSTFVDVGSVVVDKLGMHYTVRIYQHANHNHDFSQLYVK
ncbi:hypothetical protein [Stutzerimonas nitrititolerans]|uniref:hypothetical protein n=1 Tax=Stutzerimonas nitrititolerans TaxID=2482751 RepID=UPI00289A7A27|nr:hypothetical protein [Stutzerimonas nitrititolerans]